MHDIVCKSNPHELKTEYGKGRSMLLMDQHSVDQHFVDQHFVDQHFVSILTENLPI